MKNSILSALVFLGYTASGQANLFQDAKGESAMKLFGSSVAVTTKDEAISIAAGKYYRDSSPKLFHRWAVTIELKANEGLSSIKDDGKYLIDGAVGFYYGWKMASSASGNAPGSAREIFVAGNIGTDRNKLFNTALPPEDMVYSNGEFVYKMELGQFGYTGNLLYGISASYKQQTNVDDSKTKSVNFLGYSSPNDSTLVYLEKQAYDKNEFIGDQHVLSFNFDGALLVNQKKVVGQGSVPPLFLALHFRYQHLKGDHGEINPAIGLYLGKHGAPRTIVGGFNVQFLDLLNAKNEKTNAWDRAAINFVVGIRLAK